jgi:2,5-dichloro-2,5-cyclohexadiene-1,4-diol dehydrogenase 1
VQRFSGKSVIVTGGSSGIGRAAVQRLVAEGAMVTIADTNTDWGAATVTRVNAGGPGRAQFVHTDVSDEDSVRSMTLASVEHFGQLHGAINAAGIAPRGIPIHKLSLKDWDFCHGINLRGVFLCMKYQIDQLLKSGGGAIVAVSSNSALLGMVNTSEYAASKAGVTGLVRAAAIEGAPFGIRVNALLPGATDTPLVQVSKANNPELAGKNPLPLGRMAKPEEIAAGAVWMISDEASYMTGACVVIDGGMSVT